MHSACPTCPIIDLAFPVVFDDDCKYKYEAPLNAFFSPVSFTSSVLGFDIFLRSFYSEVTKLIPSGNINDQLLCDIQAAIFYFNCKIQSATAD
jgi:hypothetical protein